MTERPSILRSALRLFSLRLVLGQIELAGLLALLFVIWLRIPDASALDIIATILLALLIIAIAGVGESFVLLRLCGRQRTRRRLLLGTLFLVVGVALWFGWSALIGSLSANDWQRASYYNSRLPEQLRYFFTYQRIGQWISWMWNTLEWAGTGLLALAAAALTCSSKPLRAVAAGLRSITFWLALLAASFAASAVTSSLIGWTPGHGLSREMLSLIFRLGVIVIFDAVALGVVLTIIAACCRSAEGNIPEGNTDTPQSTPAGTPDLNQPRTAGNP